MIMITVMHWHKCIMIVQKLALVSYEPFCLPVVCHCSRAQSDCLWQYSSRERPMKILSTSSWLPSCTDNNVIMYCLPSGRHGSLELDQLNSMVIAWRALNGKSHELAAYNYTSSIAPLDNAWVQAGGCKQSLSWYAKIRVRPAATVWLLLVM